MTLERLQVFDFEAMRAYPSLLEPLLFYVLHRVSERVLDPSRGRHVEGVRHGRGVAASFSTRRCAAYVQEALKTWRKRNAAMLLATQSVDDFASVDLLRTVVESCPTKLLLANPSLDRRQYARAVPDERQELDLLAGLMPRQQVLLKRPGSAKVLTLRVDPQSYWIYTNTPVDNERVAAHPPRAWIRRRASTAWRRLPDLTRCRMSVTGVSCSAVVALLAGSRSGSRPRWRRTRASAR